MHGSTPCGPDTPYPVLTMTALHSAFLVLPSVSSSSHCSHVPPTNQTCTSHTLSLLSLILIPSTICSWDSAPASQKKLDSTPHFIWKRTRNHNCIPSQPPPSRFFLLFLQQKNNASIVKLFGDLRPSNKQNEILATLKSFFRCLCKARKR